MIQHLFVANMSYLKKILHFKNDTHECLEEESKLAEVICFTFSGELDAKKGRDISAFNLEVHLSLHLFNQLVKSSTIFAKPEAVINIGETDGMLVHKEARINVL